MGELADTEPLMALPALPYPATIEAAAAVDHQASVAFRGNRYSVPPGFRGATMQLFHRFGQRRPWRWSARRGSCWSPTAWPRPGAGLMVRTPEHREALEKVILGQFSTARPCDRKENRPPGPAALAERARLLGQADAGEPSVDLEELAEVIRLAFPGSTDVDGAEVTA